MNKSLFCSLLFFVSVGLSAQTGGDNRNEFLRRSSAQAQEYRSGKRQEYGAFLRRTWNATAESQPKEDPFRRGDAGRPAEDPPQDVVTPISDVPAIPKTIPLDEEAISRGSFPFRFYGRTYKVRYDNHDIPLPSVGEQDVAKAWDELAVSATPLLDDCLTIRDSESLCDWAYLQLIDSLSTTIYPSALNKRELLFGFLMGMSGYNIRFGRSGDDLTCLYAAEQIIYARPYFSKDGAYFFRHRPGQGALELSDSSPVAARPLDLTLTRSPAFTSGHEMVRHIETGGIGFDFRIPQSQLDFYASSPHTEMYIKADAPVSEAVKETVYPALSSSISGLGEVDAVNKLLGFVQGLMEYRTDGSRWGYEKWSFPEESFYYLCGDCDDHAILFSRLVRDLVGLDVLLVECEVDGAPHETTAVRLSEPLNGDTILYQGDVYYCCEPTSNVAKVGERRWKNYVVKRLDKVK